MIMTVYIFTETTASRCSPEILTLLEKGAAELFPTSERQIGVEFSEQEIIRFGSGRQGAAIALSVSNDFDFEAFLPPHTGGLANYLEVCDPGVAAELDILNPDSKKRVI